MSQQNVSKDIANIDSFLQQLRQKSTGGSSPSVVTGKNDPKSQTSPPVSTNSSIVPEEPQKVTIREEVPLIDLDPVSFGNPLTLSPPPQGVGSKVGTTESRSLAEEDFIATTSSSTATRTQDVVEGEKPTLSNLVNPSVDPVVLQSAGYRSTPLVCYSTSDSSSSSEESDASASRSGSSDSSDDEASERGGETPDQSGRKGFKKHHGPQLKGEILPTDLPDIGKLSINLSNEYELELCGKVTSKVDDLVVVEGLRESRALNSETVLWNADRKAVGIIYEVFGPVKLPYYSVRVSTDPEAQDLSVGTQVFYASNHKDYTQFVFIDQIQNVKGSDASWEHDLEPPPQCLDYSDDEVERAANRKQQAKRRGIPGDVEPEGLPDQSSKSSRKKVHKHKKQNKHRHQHQNLGHPYQAMMGQPPPPNMGMPHPQTANFGMEMGMPPNMNPGMQPRYGMGYPPGPPPHLAGPLPPSQYTRDPNMQAYFGGVSSRPPPPLMGGIYPFQEAHQKPNQ